MDHQQLRIIEDLNGAFRGELRFDAATRSVYACDGSLYQVTPLGIAFPRDVQDVRALVRYCRENQIPVIPRGAGTGVAGGALGQGIVVDFSRHFTAIESIEGDLVRVQAGVVLDRLNAALRPHGRYLPPDPSTAHVTTVGGMLAVDAAGAHAMRVGAMRDYAHSINSVLANGHEFEARRENLLELLHRLPRHTDSSTLLDRPSWHADPTRLIYSQVAKLLRDNMELIQKRQPALVRNCAGYMLRGVLTGDELDMPRMLVGSEGTLALFTGATLYTAPLPAHRGVSLLLFGNIEAAIRAAHALAEQQPSACDLLDRRLLSLARESNPRFEAMISRSAEAALVVEQTGFSATQTLDRLRMASRTARQFDSHLIVGLQTADPAEVDFVWTLPYRTVSLLTGVKGTERPLPLIEALAVPPEALREFQVRAQRVLQKYEITASLYAHAATGQVHLRPFLKPPTSADGPRLESLARDIYDVVFALGGTISGEHGDGLSRTAFLRTQYGPLYRVFRDLKQIFDPEAILNPGKIISDDPRLTVRYLRPRQPDPNPEFVPLQLNWSISEFADEAGECNSCGTCRTHESPLRMCPFFRSQPDEEASPRAKANVARAYATGTVSARDLAAEQFKQIADLCFNCKQCQVECPSNVDIPHLLLETRAAYVSANGLTREDWALARAHTFGALGSNTTPVSNWILNNPLARWVIEKILHIAKERKLPAFASRSFLKSCRKTLSQKDRVAGGKRPVVYFVDQYANFHDVQLARAFVEVLRHNGIEVYVPAEQTASGMAMVSAGDFDAARELAEKNLRVLGELAREGLSIVCTEPAAAICLSQEYPMLIQHPDARAVAAQVLEAGEFLRQLHADGNLRTDFQPLPLSVGYHTPCHIKALGAGRSFAEILRLIPELQVHALEEGCSGMAGAFGLTKTNFAKSLELGRPLIARMQQADLTIGATECSSCRLQMEQGTMRATLHPLKLMALAYGLMPELRKRLNPNRRRLLVR